MMNAKERVQRALAFQKTDRVPRYDILLPGYQARFHETPGREHIAVYDYYDQIDIGEIRADQSGPFYDQARVLREDERERVELDSWGRTLRTLKKGYFEDVLDVPLRDKAALDAVDFTNRPASRHIEKADDLRFCPVSGCMGLFMSSYRMRGEENYLTDMAQDPDFVDDLADRLEGFLTAQGLYTAQKTQTTDTAVWVYDEFSSRTGPLFSPRMFERYFLERYRRMFGRWKAEGVKNIVLHCDGNSMPLMEMLIEAGFTAVQSMAPTANMFLPDVRRAVGNRLALIGGMDNIGTLAHGTKKEIEYQARAVYEVALEGGVVMGTHSVDDDVPVENYDYYDGLMRKWAGKDA